MRAGLVVGVLVAAVGAGLLAWQQGWRVPPAWNPWAVLDVKAPPNLLTPYKLGRLQDDPQLCAQALATSTLRYSTQADSAATVPCPLENVVRVQGSGVRLSSSFLASCPLAVAYALFEQHGLQPVAQRVLGQRVTQVDHLGSFACRNVYHRKQGRLSQHATANALDKPRDNQCGGAVGQPTHQRSHGKYPQAQHQHASTAKAVGQCACRHQHAGAGQGVGVHDPLGVLETGAQLLFQGGQDDRHAGNFQAEHQCHQAHGGEGQVVSGGAGCAGARAHAAPAHAAPPSARRRLCHCGRQR